MRYTKTNKVFLCPSAWADPRVTSFYGGIRPTASSYLANGIATGKPARICMHPSRTAFLFCDTHVGFFKDSATPLDPNSTFWNFDDRKYAIKNP